MTKLSRCVSLITIVSIMFGFTACTPQFAQAASGTLSVLSDTMSRQKISTNSSHLIKFRTSVAVSTTGDTIKVTFPADFNLTSSAITDITFTHGASTGAETTETLAESPSGSAWGAAFSDTQSRILTLTAPTDGIGIAALAADHYIIITYAATHAINPTTPGSYIIYLAIAGANTANSSINIVVVTDDQVAVSATVDAALVFTISTASVGFGNFVGTAVRYATSNAQGSPTEPLDDNPVLLTASGNGSRGLTISIQDNGNGSDPGLYNSVETELIPSAASSDVDPASKTYGVYGKNAATLVIDEAFDNDGTLDEPIDRDPQTFATYNTVGGGSLDLSLIAAINATTKPGAYVDTITLICTGLY